MSAGLAPAAHGRERSAGAPAPHSSWPVVDIGPSGGVGVHNLDEDLARALRCYLQSGGLPQSILRVTVVAAAMSIDADAPSIFGRYRMIDGTLQFIPYFPFERGMSYRAVFDPRPLGYERSEVVTQEFSLPREENVAPAQVTHIFPSGDMLPENLLRFTIRFSHPMRRGRAESEIVLLGPDGEPAPDVLYRAPLELWDRSMRQLTILLDPGRLKRGVGPNRELGPPLKPGEAYTLAIGDGMTDLHGSRLSGAVHKRFRVTDAVREPVAVAQWGIRPPATHSRQPLTLTFPRPMDWALLRQMITVTASDGRKIDGEITIGRCERRWCLTRRSPWAAGSYEVRVASGLEDVCGNNLIAAFDRPLQARGDLTYETADQSIPFHLT